VPLDDHQQVVEVVRNAARQAANGFHLLRLAQLQFQVAALADILCDDQAHAPARIN
jgi:hypothetical protein